MPSRIFHGKVYATWETQRYILQFSLSNVWISDTICVSTRKTSNELEKIKLKTIKRCPRGQLARMQSIKLKFGVRLKMHIVCIGTNSSSKVKGACRSTKSTWRVLLRKTIKVGRVLNVFLPSGCLFFIFTQNVAMIIHDTVVVAVSNTNH